MKSIADKLKSKSRKQFKTKQKLGKQKAEIEQGKG